MEQDNHDRTMAALLTKLQCKQQERRGVKRGEGRKRNVFTGVV